MIKKIAIFSLSVTLLALLSAIVYGWHLSGKVSERFSSRRWSIPSKVFTDTMLLYPGQRLNRRLFQEKLKRLGYREASARPARKGEMQTIRKGIRIFLNDLKTPWKDRPGFLIKIEISRNTIKSLVRQDNGKFMQLLPVTSQPLF